MLTRNKIGFLYSTSETLPQIRSKEEPVDCLFGRLRRGNFLLYVSECQ